MTILASNNVRYRTFGIDGAFGRPRELEEPGYHAREARHVFDAQPTRLVAAATGSLAERLFERAGMLGLAQIVFAKETST